METPAYRKMNPYMFLHFCHLSVCTDKRLVSDWKHLLCCVKAMICNINQTFQTDLLEMALNYQLAKYTCILYYSSER